MLDAVSEQGSVMSKYVGSHDVNMLVLGAPHDAALGLASLLKVDMLELFGKLARGVSAIVEEIEAHGTAVDCECLEYVLRQRAGSSPELFVNSPHARDCDAKGLRHDRIAASGE